MLAGVTPLAVHARYLGLIVAPVWVFPSLVLALLTVAIWTRGADGKPIGAVSSTMLGVSYTGMMLSFAYAIRYHDYAVGAPTVRVGGTRFGVAAGGLLLALPLILTWATDIGAYVVGRAFGRRKLLPAVSPGKTVAGAFGGVVASILVATLYVRGVLRPGTQLGFTPWGLAIFAVVVSAAAEIGDLVESLLKREAGVKDSSQLIPGHGGVLDRIDSLLFVLPVSYALFSALLVWAP